MEVRRFYFTSNSDAQTANITSLNPSIGNLKQIPLLSYNLVSKAVDSIILAVSNAFRFTKLHIRRWFWMLQFGIKRQFVGIRQVFAKNKQQSTDSYLKLENKPRRKINKKFILAGFFVILFLTSAFATKALLSYSKNDLTANTPDMDTRINVLGAKATMDINREFEFPLRDEDGEEVSKVKYTIENAGLHDEIVVQGKRYSAIKGRTFLILMLKIVNDYDQSIEINTKDYIRLSVNDDQDERLAPEIHNDPVLIQAISIKKTRLGFPINDEDKNLNLYVGEISGDKEKFQISFE